MNDDFLHRLRAEPPPHFALRLKARLEDVPMRAERPRHPAALRTLLIAVLIGGGAFAVTAISVRGVPQVFLDVFEQAARDPAAASTPPARASEPPPGELVIPDQPDAPHRAPKLAPIERASGAKSVWGTESASASASTTTSVGTMPVSAAARAQMQRPPFVAVSDATFPFAQSVAEQLKPDRASRKTKIENLGDTVALQKLCAGSGSDFPDVVMTARRITAAELRACLRNTPDGIQEMKIGSQAVVVARPSELPEFELSTKALFLALAKRVPQPDDPRRLMTNPFTVWEEVGATPGYNLIRILGPSLQSPVGAAFVEMLLGSGCRGFASLQAMQSGEDGASDSVCRAIRADGVYSDSGLDQTVAAQNVRSNSGTVGVFTFSYVARSKTLTAAAIDGIAANRETIANGTYAGSRILYLYLKGEDFLTNPGVEQFVDRVDREANTFGSTFEPLGLNIFMNTASYRDRQPKELRLKDLQP